MKNIKIIELLKQSKSDKKLTMMEIASRSKVGIRTVNRIFAGEDVRFSSMLAVLDTLDIELNAHMKTKEKEG